MFTINFSSSGSGMFNVALQRSSSDLGVEGVDLLRQLLSLPGLPVGRMVPQSKEVRRDVQLPAGEELARESGLFTQRNHVTVKVERGALNGFLYPAANVLDKGDDGSVLRVQLDYQINPSDVLLAWQSAGYPLNWETPENWH